MRMTCVVITIGALLAGSSLALDMDALKVKRQEVFQFTQKPVVTRQGDNVMVSFATKAFCDVTVAIENGDGKIVRHLASGVLGDNAPHPFKKNSKKQTVVWDGKDEIGRYVDDKDSHTLRVSLGLKPQFERTLYWSGQKMGSGSGGTFSLLMKAAPEGMYVWFDGQVPHLRLFDHDGNYLRTLYPFPADKMKKVIGLKWQEYPPDNVRLPSKLLNHDQDSLLKDKTVREIIAQGNRLWLLGSHLMPMATDGSSGGRSLDGPKIGYDDKNKRPRSEGFFRPYSAAVSPDGKRLYLTCYTMVHNQPGYPARREWMHGINVIDTGKDGKMSLFAGNMKTFGSDKAHFKGPMSVACDAKGRVYVADNINSRIQVYQSDGKLLKSIPTHRPGIVRIHPKTGEIWVVSSNVGIWDRRISNTLQLQKGVPLVVRCLGTLENPGKKAAYPLKAPRFDYNRSQSIWDLNVEIDFYTDPPTIWTSAAAIATGEPAHLRCNARLWQPSGRKLKLKRSFAADAKKALKRARPPHFSRPRLWVNPADGKLYMGLIGWDTPVACKSFRELVVIDPETGKIKVAALPTNPEDMGFDWEGRAYLRTHDTITRFDSRTWREIPFDYGEERIVKHDDGGPKKYKAASAITFQGCMGVMFYLGGFGVAADGTMAVSCWNPNASVARKVMKKKVHYAVGGKPYKPPIYPGRYYMGYETHLFDIHGKLLKADVTPGLGMCNMVQVDRENNVYVLASASPYLDGKRYFNSYGCTLIKFKPGAMKLFTPGGVIPLTEAQQPKRPFDMGAPPLWVEGAEWLFGPVGADAKHPGSGKCGCYVNGRFALDYYGRSFAPEVDRFRMVVLDTNGNVILRFGRYGNVEDGMPLIKEGGPPSPRSIGGDEIAIMHAMNVAVDTDRRFFFADVGNARISSVKLGYHVNEVVVLRDVKDQGK